jgi:hypothetical protein
MRRDLLSGLAQQQRPFLANMLLPNNRILAGLTALDLLRGWTDDFFGDGLHEQYSTHSYGTGSSGALLTSAHGGIYRLTAGAGDGRYHDLRLADGYTPIDADEGWVMIARFSISSTGNLAALVGAKDASPATENLDCGIDTDAGHSNWVIRTRTGGGAVVYTNSGIASDTNMHWHRLDAYPITGGRRADYYLDGTLIATTSTNIPAVLMMPYWMAYSREAASKYIDLDIAVVIPRNLA